MRVTLVWLMSCLPAAALLAADAPHPPNPQSTTGAPVQADRQHSKNETGTAVRQGPRQLKPSEHGVGRRIPDVEFQDVEGRLHKLSECALRELTVVAVTSTSCPISKRYLPTLAQLEKSYDARKVAFVFVNPTPSDSDDDIRSAIQTHGLRGPYVRDSEGRLLGRLGPRRPQSVLCSTRPARSCTAERSMTSTALAIRSTRRAEPC